MFINTTEPIANHRTLIDIEPRTPNIIPPEPGSNPEPLRTVSLFWDRTYSPFVEAASVKNSSAKVRILDVRVSLEQCGESLPSPEVFD